MPRTVLRNFLSKSSHDFAPIISNAHSSMAASTTAPTMRQNLLFTLGCL